jgi:hypothetical protein
MGDSTKSFTTSLSEDDVTGTLDLLKKSCTKYIGCIHQECHKLIEQSSRKGCFQEPHATTSAHSINGDGQNFTKKNTMSLQSYGKAVPWAQKVNFSISQYYMYYYSQRPGEVITTNFIDGFIMNIFRLLYIPNKTPNLRNRKVFPNGKCPINVKKIDVKEVMKYTEYGHQDFWILTWETTSKEDQGE